MWRSNIAFRIHYLHIEFNITFISIFWKCKKNKCVSAYSLKGKSLWIVQRRSSESTLLYFSKGMRKVSMLLLLLDMETVSSFHSWSLNPAMPSQQSVVHTTSNDKSFNRHFSGIKKKSNTLPPWCHVAIFVLGCHVSKLYIIGLSASPCVSEITKQNKASIYYRIYLVSAE